MNKLKSGSKSVLKSVSKTLKTPVVLYLIIALSVLNVIGYLSLFDYMSLLVFTTVALGGRYFMPKNTAGYLALALFLTSLYNTRRAIEYFTEGMDNKDKETEEEEKKSSCNPDDPDYEECLKEEKQSAFTQRSPPKRIDGEEEDDSVGTRIDYASTLEKAYDNLQDMVGKRGVNNLMKDTQKLVEQQKSLMNVITNITPTLEKANDTLKGFNLDSDFGRIKKDVSGK